MSHTPGPWIARLNHWSRWEIHYVGGQLAAIAKHDDPSSPPPAHECRANARLIASAPELLSALKSCVDVLIVGATRERDAALALIAKAEQS